MCEFLSKNLSCCLFFDSIRFEFISMIWWCVVVAFATWKKAKYNNANDDDDDFNDDDDEDGIVYCV